MTDPTEADPFDDPSYQAFIEDAANAKKRARR